MRLGSDVAVSGWSVVIAVAVVGAIAGTNYDILGNLNAFPRVPSSLSDLTLQAVVLLAAWCSRACSARWRVAWPACISTARSTRSAPSLSAVSVTGAPIL